MTDANTSRKDPQQHLRMDSESAAITVARNRAGCALVIAVGEIDALSVDEFETALRSQPATETEAVVVDLARVPFCSVSGLGALLSLVRRTRRHGVRLALVAGTHNVLRGLEVIGVAGAVPVHQDRAGALAAVDMPEAAFAS